MPAKAESENVEFNLPVKPSIAMKVRRLRADGDVGFGPRFEADPERSKAPVEVVTGSSAEREPVGIEHPVRVGLKDVEKNVGPDALLARVTLTEIKVPLRGVAEAERGFGPAVDVDQLSPTKVFVFGIQTHREETRVEVQHRERAEHGLVAQRRALAQKVGSTFDQKHGAWEGDDEQ